MTKTVAWMLAASAAATLGMVACAAPQVMAAAQTPAAPAAPAAQLPANPPLLEGYWRKQRGYGVNNDRAEPGRDGLARDWMAFNGYQFGETPPLTPAALERVRARVKEEMDGKIIEERTLSCMAGGFYDMVAWAATLDIHQRGNQVLFVMERDRAKPRRVFLDETRPKNLEDLERQLGGDARGHWEGDTLVVEAINIDAGPWLFLADFLKLSEEAKVTERYRVENGVLNTQWTFHDPENFTKPWVVNIKWDRLPETYEPGEETCFPNARFE